MSDIYEAAFAIGIVICHQRFGYRGVIVDVDAVFSGSDQWYEQVARSRPPKDRPWYHVLVDGGQRTYVAERHLVDDPSGHPVSHPELLDYFDAYEDGRYVRMMSPN
ncbi:MAG: heat shock protein HspQ [Chromatiales bacterium]|jgi:heat shock protein HspQ|nr:heat shock protein HspQ [Chromatiales bacterium]